MSDPYLYYDRTGRAIGFEDYCAALEGGEDAKRVAFNMVDGYAVSTVWLGTDHRFLHDGPPLIFETMVFGRGEVFPESGADGPWCDYQDRYSTETDALAGHARIVAAIENGESPYGDDGYLDLTGFTRPGGDEDGPRPGSVIAAVVLIIFVALTAWLGWALLTLGRH